MKHGSLILSLLCGLSPSLSATIPISGTLQLPKGSKMDGRITFTRLFAAAQHPSNNTAVAQTVQFSVNNEVLPSTARIIPDVTQPQNAYYTSEYFSSFGTRFATNIYYIAGMSLVLRQATPTPSNISLSRNINNVTMCDQFSGANAGAKIIAAVAALPPTGGTVDCRGLERPQSAPNGFGVGGIDAPVTLLLGGTVLTVGAPIQLFSGSHIRGLGFGTSDFSTPRTVIQSSTGDVFSISSHGASGMIIEELQAKSIAGGGHVFNLNAGITSRNTFRHLVLQQDNAGKSILSDTTNGSNFLENRIENSDLKYAAANSVPAIHIKTDSINMNHFQNLRLTGGNTQSGTYAVWLEN